MSRTPPTFYVLHGDDEFSRKAEVQNMKVRMGDPGTAELNTETFDGRSTVPGDVVAAGNAQRQSSRAQAHQARAARLCQSLQSSRQPNAVDYQAGGTLWGQD